MNAANVDARLEELAAQPFASPASAVAALVEATALVNGGLGPSPTDRAVVAAAEGDRLERWIDRLKAIAERVVDEFGALGYSITVGMPVGVSVTVSWQPHAPG
ncbi:MAG TPA: hypothetical protein VF094_08120 [Gaiellaceae bacterium]